jgi:Carboxypeptidase regulatory-like domain
MCQKIGISFETSPKRAMSKLAIRSLERKAMNAVSVLFVLIGLLDPTGLSLGGAVTDKDGAPLAGARVQIATAGPRVGEGLFCPSCYRDCAKWTDTDKEGKFTLSGLDPTLRFTLLVTMPGKKAVQTKFLDPIRGSTTIVLEPAPTNVPPARTVLLHIVDELGKPVAGALVEPYGAKTADRRWYGQVNGVDPTVSGADGQIQVVLPEGFQAVDLDIEAHGFTGALLMEQTPGPVRRQVILLSGTRVEARLVRAGKPVGGARVAVVQLERSARHHFIKAVGATSDASGKVAFEHLPADEEYAVYSVSEGEAQPFVLKTKRFKAKGNQQNRDLGDLELIPAMRLTGRLELPAGQALPPHATIALDRDPAWDLVSTSVKPDGSFAFESLAPETYSVRVVAKGYEIDATHIGYQMLGNTSFGLHLTDSMVDLRIPLAPSDAKVRK